MESRGLRAVKAMMIFVNTIVLVCGLALLGLGIWVYSSSSSFAEIVSSDPVIFNSVAVFIVIGVVLAVSGFFGCAGAIKESKCLLGTYFAILALIFIAEVVVVILVFVYYPRFRDAVVSTTTTNRTDTTLASAWDVIQRTFQCCGFNNVSDWRETIPNSCCLNANATFPCSFSQAYRQGCESTVRQYFWVLGGVGIAILAFEILSMAFTCCMYRGIGEDYEFA